MKILAHEDEEAHLGKQVLENVRDILCQTKTARDNTTLTFRNAVVASVSVPYPSNSHVIEGHYYNNTDNLQFELVKNKKTLVHVNSILTVVSTPKPTDKLCISHEFHESLLRTVEHCML